MNNVATNDYFKQYKFKREKVIFHNSLLYIAICKHK